ncbi:EthD family reductase [Geodermatophilus sabuli]|uniref:EthD family reductase n=1 Tax=Geodermatophilus sabuli TaxID=1564158 RepID=A0A7K3VWN8_9ACTN|nr:EthD family reductase [Geodermatophilus sabuli]NEK57065.1 EthD family reductase [Geodermatophilus sabuli]
MVHRMVVQYGQPTDAAVFEERYREHIRLINEAPGVLRYTVGRPAARNGEPPATYLVAELDFESAEAMAATMRTPEWAAAGEDVPTFATGGVSVTFFDLEDVGTTPAG